MPTNARRRHPLDPGGPWGWGLLLLGVACLIIGAAYIFRPADHLPPALAWVNQAIPVSVWAVGWLIAAGYSIAQAVTPPQRHRDMAPAVFMISLWAGFYLAFWVVSAIHGRWDGNSGIAAVTWGCMAGLLVCFGRCVNPPRHGRRG